jgi:putative transposase
MAKRRHTTEQIIGKLREAEVELAKGQALGEVVRKLGITEQTYYRWRKEYGGLRPIRLVGSRSWRRRTPG